MSDERIKVGVVGVGHLGRFHAQKYACLPEAQLVGVVDIDQGRSQQVAAETNSLPFAHHEELLGKVNAVSIAVPTHAHYEVAKVFLAAGVDVLLEKPIAANLQQASELAELARDNGVILQIGHLERFNGALQVLRGVLTTPIFIDAHRLSPYTGRGVDVDVVLDLMIHDIDIILSIVPDAVSRVEGEGISLYPPLLDCAHASLWFAKGCVAQLVASRVSHERVRQMLIFQDDASITIDYIGERLTICRRGRARVEVKEKLCQGDPLEREIRSFLDCVRTRAKPICSGEDGVRALEVAIRITETIRQRG